MIAKIINDHKWHRLQGFPQVPPKKNNATSTSSSRSLFLASLRWACLAFVESGGINWSETICRSKFPALWVSAKALWADLLQRIFYATSLERQKVQLRVILIKGKQVKANSFSRKRSDKKKIERPYHVHAQFDKCKKQGCENLSSQTTLTFSDPQMSNLLANEWSKKIHQKPGILATRSTANPRKSTSSESKLQRW